MLKRLQSARMFELGDSASITKLRRASKMEFDVHGMCGSIEMLLVGLCQPTIVATAQSVDPSDLARLTQREHRHGV